MSNSIKSRLFFLPQSTSVQIITMVTIFLGVICIWTLKPPFFLNALFGILCFLWSGWTFISIFRGTDELKSASVRYALAAASGVGVPLSVAFVMLMIAREDIQLAITQIAGKSPLWPAAAGFGLGVSFTIIVMSSVFIISHTVWWASKR